MLNLFNVDNASTFQNMLADVGRTITVNNTDTMQAIITNTKLESNYDDRKVSTLEQLECGDLIEYNNKSYMVISEVNDKRYGHYKGIMRHLPHQITFNVNCRFQTVSAYIENSNPSFTGGQVITLIEDKIIVYMPAKSIHLNLTSGNEFMIHGNKFKIITMDTFSKTGIAILTCKREQTNPAADDIEHNIADGLACPINITNSKPISIELNSTLQLYWTSPYNAPVIFKSSDTSIATVDAEGLVTGIAEGDVTITATNSSNGLIFDSVTITVTADDDNVHANKTIELVYDKPNQYLDDYYYLYSNKTHTFTATVYEGLEATDETVTFEMFGDDKVSAPSTNMFTGSSSGNIYTISSKSVFGYLQLKVTLDSDPSIYVWQRIRIRSLF